MIECQCEVFALYPRDRDIEHVRQRMIERAVDQYIREQCKNFFRKIIAECLEAFRLFGTALRDTLECFSCTDGKRHALCAGPQPALLLASEH